MSHVNRRRDDQKVVDEKKKKKFIEILCIEILSKLNFLCSAKKFHAEFKNQIQFRGKNPFPIKIQCVSVCA